MREDRTATTSLIPGVESDVEDHTPVIRPVDLLPEREADEPDADDPEAGPEAMRPYLRAKAEAVIGRVVALLTERRRE